MGWFRKLLKRGPFRGEVLHVGDRIISIIDEDVDLTFHVCTGGSNFGTRYRCGDIRTLSHSDRLVVLDVLVDKVRCGLLSFSRTEFGLCNKEPPPYLTVTIPISNARGCSVMTKLGDDEVSLLERTKAGL